MGNILSQTLIPRVLWLSHFHLSMSWIPPILFVLICESHHYPSFTFLTFHIHQISSLIKKLYTIMFVPWHLLLWFFSPHYLTLNQMKLYMSGLKRERIHVAFQLVFGRGQELLCYIVTTQRNELAIFELPSSLSFRPNCKKTGLYFEVPLNYKKIPRTEASKQNVIAMWSNC